MDVRAALREGAYALTAHSRVRSELLQDGPCLHVGLRREALRVEFARLGEVLPIHLVRPRVCVTYILLTILRSIRRSRTTHGHDYIAEEQKPKLSTRTIT